MIIDLPRRIDPELAADLEKESAFVSPLLTRLRVAGERDRVELEIADHDRDGEVQAKVQRFLNATLKRTHRFETKVFLETERQDSGPFATGVHDELVRRGWVFDYGRGHVALAGPVLALARLIDASAGELYARHFGALPGSYPAFVDAGILHRCGYFDSHPNAVSFVGHLVPDFDAIEAYRQANCCAEGALIPAADQVHLPGLCLNPAACFPCYPTLEAGRSARMAPPSPGRAGCSATNRATSPASIACGSSTSASWCSSAATSMSPRAAGACCR
jgi:hypothetical protein